MSTPPAVVSPTGTYTDVTFPDVDGGYDELAWSVTVRTDPSPDGYFWSHQFGLVGGEQAYCGLQTYNAELGGKVAIFSIWRALGARGPQFAATFGGEGTGFSARIRYEWRVDVTYRLTVRRAEAGWWRAEVADPISGRTDEIGEIEVDRAWGGIASRSVMWSERYAGPLRICSDIRHSVVDRRRVDRRDRVPPPPLRPADVSQLPGRRVAQRRRPAHGHPARGSRRGYTVRMAVIAAAAPAGSSTVIASSAKSASSSSRSAGPLRSTTAAFRRNRSDPR